VPFPSPLYAQSYHMYLKMLKMHALNRAIPGSFSTKQRSSCAFAGPSAPLKSKRTLPVLKAAQEARQEADGLYSLEKEGSNGGLTKTDVFIDRQGQFVQVMCTDYGYRSGVGRMYQAADGTIPVSGFELALDNFKRELASLRRSVRMDEYARVTNASPPSSLPRKAAFELGGLVVQGFAALDKKLEEAKVLPKLEATPESPDVVDPATGEVKSEYQRIRQKLLQLKLSNKKVMEREHKRESSGGKVETSWYVRLLYNVVCFMLDVLFDNRPIQRFWFLETVARMPYFSYISCIHLYETLGWWRAAAELRKIHFAEEWNELHHLQIMEALGGDRLWFDRFLGYHAAIAYYWVLIALYIFSPKQSYAFSELLESHAVDTYGEFVDANEELLKVGSARLVCVIAPSLLLSPNSELAKPSCGRPCPILGSLFSRGCSELSGKLPNPC